MIKKLGSIVALIAVFAISNVAHASIKVGDPAPDFSMRGSDGKVHTLADYKGKQAIVIAWFPKAFTSGCTIECKSLADNGHLLKKFNAQYFMASTDDASDNERFAKETKADFPLLSDPDGEAAEAFGVKSFLGYAKRHTYYIDKSGKVVMIDKNVRPATSAEDMAKYMKMLDFEQVAE